MDKAGFPNGSRYTFVYLESFAPGVNSLMLMVTISICMNLIIQLNSKDYETTERKNTLIRVITVGALVIASLAYGISKTIPSNELNLDTVFKVAVVLMIYAFVAGTACEYKKKERN